MFKSEHFKNENIRGFAIKEILRGYVYCLLICYLIIFISKYTVSNGHFTSLYTSVVNSEYTLKVILSIVASLLSVAIIIVVSIINVIEEICNLITLLVPYWVYDNHIFNRFKLLDIYKLSNYRVKDLLERELELTRK